VTVADTAVFVYDSLVKRVDLVIPSSSEPGAGRLWVDATRVDFDMKLNGVPMDPLSHRLARALASRLQVVLPPSLTVSVHGSGVSLYANGAPVGGNANAALIDDETDETPGERAARAVRGFLSAMQDDISEELTEPWPEDIGYQMALPGAREEGGQVFLWYGDNESDPRVAFPPIDLTNLGRSSAGSPEA
jgi:hypothetical protein